VAELSAREGDAWYRANRPDLSMVKCVPARRSFLIYRTEIRVYCQARRSVGGEALELGMMPIAGGLTTQYSLRQESLSPQRHQALWVEILRMQ
jgi:hypothetical protein